MSPSEASGLQQKLHTHHLGSKLGDLVAQASNEAHAVLLTSQPILAANWMARWPRPPMPMTVTFMPGCVTSLVIGKV